MKKMSWTTKKILYFGGSIVSILAIFPMPIEFYAIVRLVVFVGFAVAAFQLYQEKNLGLMCVVIGLAVLFNPIFEVYFYYRGLWLFPNLASSAIFYWLFSKEVCE